MSWGDVWVSGGTERPEVGPGVPKAPWVKAGVFTREERAFVDAMQKLRGTRKGQPRAIDFTLTVHNRDVAMSQDDAKPGALAFAPHGLWLLVDVTPAGAESPRYAATVLKVHAVTGRRNPPAGKGARRQALSYALRAKAEHMGTSPLELVSSGDRD